MKYRILFIFSCTVFLLAGLALSRNAYANSDRNSVNSEYNFIDSPPVRHISEPVLTTADTAKGTHVEVQRNVENSNPVHVVNPQ